jgi:hypothetical protein
VVRFVRDPEQLVVNVIALISLVATVLIRIVFPDAKPWFPRGGEVATLLDDLSIAYIAAWFFYFFVSWWPIDKTRRRIAVMAARQSWTAVTHSSQLADALRAAAGKVGSGRMTRDELNEVCHQLKQMTSVRDVGIPKVGQDEPAIRVIARYVELMRADVEPILTVSALFDPDVVADAASMRSADFATDSRDAPVIEAHLKPIGVPGADMTYIVDRLADFMHRAEQLWTTVSRRYPAEADRAINP